MKKQTEDEYIFSNFLFFCELSFQIASTYINISCEKPSIDD